MENLKNIKIRFRSMKDKGFEWYCVSEDVSRRYLDKNGYFASFKESDVMFKTRRELIGTLKKYYKLSNITRGPLPTDNFTKIISTKYTK